MEVDLVRLGRFLDMLGSEHLGERGNAASLIAKMATAQKMHVSEFIRKAYSGNGASRAAPPPPPPGSGSTASQRAQEQARARKPEPASSQEREVSELIRDLNEMFDPDSATCLTDWEQTFAKSLIDREPSRLSDKQMHYLQKVLQKLSRYHS